MGRYIDWSITVPLQMVEFYFILSAVKSDLGAGMFFRLFLGTVAMLAFGYSGEAGFMNAWAAFGLGLCGWAFILFEILVGPAGQESKALGGHVATAFQIMTFIVTVGWSIYPLGYYFGYLMSSVDDSTLNLVYNLADFVNKIAFCLAIWHCAKNDTHEKIASCRRVQTSCLRGRCVECSERCHAFFLIFKAVKWVIFLTFPASSLCVDVYEIA